MARTLPLVRLSGIVLPFEIIRVRTPSDSERDHFRGHVVLGFVENSKLRDVGILAEATPEVSGGHIILRAKGRVSLDSTVVDGGTDGGGASVRPQRHQAELGDPTRVKQLISRLKDSLSGTSRGKGLGGIGGLGGLGGGVLESYPGEFADILASLLVTTKERALRIQLLEGTIEKRLEIVYMLLKKMTEEESSSSAVEETYLRQLNERGAGDEIIKAVQQEIKKLSSMNELHPSYAGQVAYLGVVCTIPWNVLGEKRELTLREVRDVLNAGHFGLSDVKQRVVEYVAVLKMNASSAGSTGPILLLVGPPGTGKTSIAKSVAECIGKKFERISLGGVRDEAEIRGHRRTYIGSFPGKVVNALRKSGVSDPLILIDEVDKVATNSGRGDVSAALLELLDPEQNTAFKDHYVDLPINLSKVTFVCTANSLDTVPAPLIDRCEVVELSSYTLAEKRVIAQLHLLPNVLRQCGLGSEDLTLTKEAIDSIILEYTREAGVRGLRKMLEAVARHVVVSRVEEGIADSISHQEISEIGVSDIREILGPPRFSRPNVSACSVGSATGLVWTPVGGSCQLVECLWVPDGGGSDESPLSSRLVLTGSAGEVLHESAVIALSWLRANRDRLTGSHSNQVSLPKSSTIHIHLPAGAVPKDGPSAGITILVALFSLLTGDSVTQMMAFTGELSLLGHVLPVGGIKEKLIAAHTAGMRAVVLPEKNLLLARKCLADERLEGDLQLVPVTFADQVLEAAFHGLSSADSQCHLASRI